MMLRLRTSLFLLYVLQSVVLSEDVPAYKHGISPFQSSAQQTIPLASIAQNTSPGTDHARQEDVNTSPGTDHARQEDVNTSPGTDHARQEDVNTSPGTDRERQEDVKLAIKTKPVSLKFLKDNLGRTSSRFGFIKFLTDYYGGHRHFNRLISRTSRSTRNIKRHELHKNRESNNDNVGTRNLQGKVSVEKRKEVTVRPESSNYNTPMDGKNIIVKESYQRASRTVEYLHDDFGYTNDDFERFDGALHNINRMESNSDDDCNYPTKFIVHVLDPLNPRLVFLPACIILYRCMNYSGCCGNTRYECAPKSTAIVSEFFMTVNTNEDTTDFDPKMARYIDFINHTACECREKPRPPACNKRCPIPFQLSSYMGCSCYCPQRAGVDSAPCISIYEGVLPVSANDLRCIRDGSCYAPNCESDEFDINTGFCPLSDEFALPAFMFRRPGDRRLYRDHMSSFNFSLPSYFPYLGNPTIPLSPSASTLTLTENGQNISTNPSTLLVNVTGLIREWSASPENILQSTVRRAITDSTESNNILSTATESNQNIAASLLASKKSIHDQQSTTSTSNVDIRNVEDTNEMSRDFKGDAVLPSDGLKDHQSLSRSTSQVEDDNVDVRDASEDDTD